MAVAKPCTIVMNIKHSMPLILFSPSLPLLSLAINFSITMSALNLGAEVSLANLWSFCCMHSKPKGRSLLLNSFNSFSDRSLYSFSSPLQALFKISRISPLVGKPFPLVWPLVFPFSFPLVLMSSSATNLAIQIRNAFSRVLYFFGRALTKASTFCTISFSEDFFASAISFVKDFLYRT